MPRTVQDGEVALQLASSLWDWTGQTLEILFLQGPGGCRAVTNKRSSQW